MPRILFYTSSREGLPSALFRSPNTIIFTPYSQQWPDDIQEILATPEVLQDLIPSLAMAKEPPRPDLTASSATIPSDSENYSSSQTELSPSLPSSSSSPMILYSPPTIWGLLRGAAINVLLPFVNGLMLGFGELFAHEAAFRLGWSGTKVCISTSLQSLGLECRLQLRFMNSLYLSICSPYFLDRADGGFHQIFPSGRSSRSVGPGIEIRDDPSERIRRERELDDITSLE